MSHTHVFLPSGKVLNVFPSLQRDSPLLSPSPPPSLLLTPQDHVLHILSAESTSHTQVIKVFSEQDGSIAILMIFIIICRCMAMSVYLFSIPLAQGYRLRVFQGSIICLFCALYLGAICSTWCSEKLLNKWRRKLLFYLSEYFKNSIVLRDMQAETTLWKYCITYTNG